MANNALDEAIIGEFQKAGGRKALLKKMVRKGLQAVSDTPFGASGVIGKGAQAVSDTFGAHDLVKYAGAKIAKKIVKPEERKYVEDKTSGAKAAKSAANLAAVVGTILMGGGTGKLLASGFAKRAGAAAKAATRARVMTGAGVALGYGGVLAGMKADKRQERNEYEQERYRR